jgi:hypothetical protein
MGTERAASARSGKYTHSGAGSDARNYEESRG